MADRHIDIAITYTHAHMHSIEELNRKIWYRLLKVVYVLALIAVVGVTLVIAWSDASYKPFDPAQFGATPAQLNDIGFVPDPSLNAAPAAAPPQPASFSSRFFSETIPALVVELLLFEITRRLFYYIVLGSWRPKK